MSGIDLSGVERLFVANTVCRTAKQQETKSNTTEVSAWP